jgi:hypothetical protein
MTIQSTIQTKFSFFFHWFPRKKNNNFTTGSYDKLCPAMVVILEFCSKWDHAMIINVTVIQLGTSLRTFAQLFSNCPEELYKN